MKKLQEFVVFWEIWEADVIRVMIGVILALQNKCKKQLWSCCVLSCSGAAVMIGDLADH